MKRLITTTLIVLLSIVGNAQERQLVTESVKLENLITFIVENYSITTDSTKTKNITFLIETYADRFNIEDSVVLKQAFKLLTKRVTAHDFISIVMHSNYNGIALNKAKATDIKKLLYALEHPKSSIKKFEEDGVEIAYDLAQTNFVANASNTVVMIRLPNREVQVNSNITANATTAKNKTKSNTLVLTAIALLPEIISVIKD